MAVAAFGPGILIATRTDVTPATPIGIGFGQSFSFEDKASNKGLYGTGKYPLVIGQGTRKVTGKFVAAMQSGIAANSIYHGVTLNTGGVQWNVNEAATVPATGPYTYQTTNHATFDSDLGVIYAATGLPLQKVSALTAAGQYTVSAGTYTFDASDEGVAVLVTSRSTVTSGQTLSQIQQLIGTGPTFQLDYYTAANQPTSKAFIARLYYCVANGLSLDFKLEDFGMPNFEFEAAANAAGNVYDKIYPDIS